MSEMKYFIVRKREADTCGNEDFDFYKYVMAESKSLVEKKYPRGFLTGYFVEEIKFEELK